MCMMITYKQVEVLGPQRVKEWLWCWDIINHSAYIHPWQEEYTLLTGAWFSAHYPILPHSVQMEIIHQKLSYNTFVQNYRIWCNLFKLWPLWEKQTIALQLSKQFFFAQNNIFDMIWYWSSFIRCWDIDPHS